MTPQSALKRLLGLFRKNPKQGSLPATQEEEELRGFELSSEIHRLIPTFRDRPGGKVSEEQKILSGNFPERKRPSPTAAPKNKGKVSQRKKTLGL